MTCWWPTDSRCSWNKSRLSLKINGDKRERAVRLLQLVCVCVSACVWSKHCPFFFFFLNSILFFPSFHLSLSAVGSGCLLPFSPPAGLLCFLWLVRLQRSVLRQDGRLSFQWLPGPYVNQLCRSPPAVAHSFFISGKKWANEERPAAPWNGPLCRCSSPRPLGLLTRQLGSQGPTVLPFKLNDATWWF